MFGCYWWTSTPVKDQAIKQQPPDGVFLVVLAMTGVVVSLRAGAFANGGDDAGRNLQARHRAAHGRTIAGTQFDRTDARADLARRSFSCRPSCQAWILKPPVFHSGYRLLWLHVLYDLPVTSKEKQKIF